MELWELPPPFYEDAELWKEAWEEDMAFTKEDEKKLTEVHTVLLGTDGSPGLAKRFEDLAKSHYKLKKYFWMLVGFLVGSGAIAGSTIWAINGG